MIRQRKNSNHVSDIFRFKLVYFLQVMMYCQQCIKIVLSLFTEKVLQSSKAFVKTTVIPVGKLAPTADSTTEQHGSTAEQCDIDERLEGWQKSWEKSTSAYGLVEPNIKWLRDNHQYGLFHASHVYKKKDGQLAERRVMRDVMQFHPPPLPCSISGSLPSMESFFTTPVFFWRPVGVGNAKIECPNRNCRAPAGSHLIKRGYSSSARQVCGEHYYYTILTERLLCPHCQKQRRRTSPDSDSDDGEDGGPQYVWMAYSPMIMMNCYPEPVPCRHLWEEGHR